MKKYNLKLNSLKEEPENEETWAISYGDMITLLLSFFVIFFSTDFSKEKVASLNNNLMKELLLDNKQKHVYKVNELNVDFENLKGFEGTKITHINDTIYVSFDNLMVFKKGDTEPTNEAKKQLKSFIEKYLPYASMYKLSVKAFTDKQKVSSKRRYTDNLELSALRSVATLRFLQHNGIPLKNMEIAGYGEMDNLSFLVEGKKLESMSKFEIENMSRTIVLIIKPKSMVLL